MQYIDLISDAIAHHTNVPFEKVKNQFHRKLSSEDRDAILLRSIMNIQFPVTEGSILLEDLKSKDLNDTIDFFFQSLQLIKAETLRQALLN